MNLKDITTEAPGGNPPTSTGKVPMGKPSDDLDLTGKAPYGGPGSGNPANDEDNNLIKDPQGQSPEGEITSKNRVALGQILDGDQQAVTEVIRALGFLKDKRGVPANYGQSLYKLIMKSIGMVIQAGVSQTKRSQDLMKQQTKMLNKQESIQQDIEEGLGYAMPGQEEDSETVTYSKTKKQGDSSVTVSANADSMDELHDILRLAGIDFEKSGDVDPTPDHKELDDEKPCSQDDDFDSNDHEDKDDVMVISPADASMSTDKEVLTNFLKDKLKKSIS